LDTCLNNTLKYLCKNFSIFWVLKYFSLHTAKERDGRFGNGYFVMIWQMILCNWFAKIGVIPPIKGGTTHALSHTDNATDPLQKD
jgi:hypothetical protein